MENRSPSNWATPKRIAIVHCHYEPGGVTQVVQNHVDCLPTQCEIALVSGPRVSGLSNSTRDRTQAVHLPSLEYDSQQSDDWMSIPAAQRGQRLAQQIAERLRSLRWTRQDSVIHWHNHSLGKNAAASYAISHLAAAGWQLLLQIHDFAEDQRPANYQHLIDQLGATSNADVDRELYPIHPNIRYAALTAGDSASLCEFGIPQQRIHTIPNSVRLPNPNPIGRDTAMRKISSAFNVPQASRWILYPVRGIRRKNVGEFLLVCQLLHRRRELSNTNDSRPPIGALTLRPDTPIEAASYDRWHRLAKQHVTNVVFDAGHHPDISFNDNLAACHCVLSTSVAEGFGMAFLEPWLAGRRVVARDLPGVTADFRQQGVQLHDLYSTVWIPGETSWVTQKEETWAKQRRTAWATVPAKMQPHLEEKSTTPLTRFDFARLTPDDQTAVITRVATDDAFAAEVISLNTMILNAIECDGVETIVEANRQTISSTYNASTQQHQLHRAYQVSNAPLEATGTNARMIDIIDRSHPFYPCRTEILPN
ncbi:glycosyltransferase family protein [Neorhodopirellula lusitana]|uniref:hypothetical protein n=1 Tax=Neorhodopirellula lusitana TaxID=445327 RepID=UPI00384F3FA8